MHARNLYFFQHGVLKVELRHIPKLKLIFWSSKNILYIFLWKRQRESYIHRRLPHPQVNRKFLRYWSIRHATFSSDRSVLLTLISVYFHFTKVQGSISSCDCNSNVLPQQRWHTFYWKCLSSSNFVNVRRSTLLVVFATVCHVHSNSNIEVHEILPATVSAICDPHGCHKILLLKINSPPK